jgi:hypothetical protein
VQLNQNRLVTPIRSPKERSSKYGLENIPPIVIQNPKIYTSDRRKSPFLDNYSCPQKKYYDIIYEEEYFCDVNYFDVRPSFIMNFRFRRDMQMFLLRFI